MSVLHVRFDGQSLDLHMAELDIGNQSSDAQIRAAAATAFEVPPTKLAAYAVDRNAESGEITLRPQAVFG